MEIQYKTKVYQESVGGLILKIECLEDLNRTIDQVFEYLEKKGDPRALEELCPYFGVVWPSARGLASYLTEISRDALDGKSVLELGCGLAIPSMIAAKRGANVVSADFHPLVPSFLSRNLELNDLRTIKYLQVNWETENPDLPQFDWVIGSDILYESRYAAPLAKTIAQKVHPQGKVVIADPGRPCLQQFVDEMSQLGFRNETKIYHVPNPPQMQEVFVISFQRT